MTDPREPGKQANPSPEASAKADPALGGLTCACRFQSVESAIRQGSETGELVDPDVPVHECDLHKALRERVFIADTEVTRLQAANAHWHLRVSQMKTDADATEVLRERVAEHDSLFDLAQKRERPWIEAWRKATGKHNTLPDYGEMLAWICDRAEAAEAHVVELAGALEAIAKGMVPTDEVPAGGLTVSSMWKWSKNLARAARAAMPSEALARARAKDEATIEVLVALTHLINAAAGWREEDLAEIGGWTNARCLVGRVTEAREARAALDALDRPAKEDAGE